MTTRRRRRHRLELGPAADRRRRPTTDEITELDRQANVTRLGQGVDTTGRLADEAIERTYKVLADYAERIDAARLRRQDRRADKRRPRLGQRPGVRATRSRQRYRPRAPRPQGRRGGPAHLPRRDQRPRPRRHDADARARHRRRLDRDDRRRRPRGAVPRLDPGRGRAPDRASPPRRPADPRADGRARKRRPPILADNVPEELRTAVNKGIAVAGTATSLAAIAQQLDPYDPTRSTATSSRPTNATGSSANSAR